MSAEYQTLLISMQKEFDDFELLKKSDSRFMKILDFLLKLFTFWQAKAFMVSFVTTIGYTVYVPSHWETWDDVQKIGVLRHERVHMRQARKYTRPLYTFLYMLFPLPFVFAYFRMKFESEAYEESMLNLAESTSAQSLHDPVYKEAMIKHFTSSEYMWMWSWRSSVERWYDDTVKKIEASLPS